MNDNQPIVTPVTPPASPPPIQDFSTSISQDVSSSMTQTAPMQPATTDAPDIKDLVPPASTVNPIASHIGPDTPISDSRQQSANGSASQSSVTDANMANLDPLSQKPQIQLDENLLETLGLGHLLKDEKNKLLNYMYQRLERRVGTKLSQSLPPEKMSEFEKILKQGEAPALQWLSQNYPGYKDLVNEQLEIVKMEVRNTHVQIIAAIDQDMRIRQMFAQLTQPPQPAPYPPQPTMPPQYAQNMAPPAPYPPQPGPRPMPPQPQPAPYPPQPTMPPQYAQNMAQMPPQYPPSVPPMPPAAPQYPPATN